MKRIIFLATLMLISVLWEMESGTIFQKIVFDLRIPRVLAAVIVGAGLSFSGRLTQSAFSNPLADPYSLGVSSFSALGAVLALVCFGASRLGGFQLGGLMGGFFALTVLFYFQKRVRAQTHHLILLGVLMSFFAAAVLTVVLALADPFRLQAATFWMLGDLSRAETLATALIALVLALGVLYFKGQSHALDALRLDRLQAESFGVSVDQLRKIVLWYVAILIGLIVSTVGIIGFVGLMIPHYVFMKNKNQSHQTLIQDDLYFGALFMLISDFLSRVIPGGIPIGAITTMLAFPVLMKYLLKAKGSTDES